MIVGVNVANMPKFGIAKYIFVRLHMLNFEILWKNEQKLLEKRNVND